MEKELIEKNPVLNLSFNFSLAIIEYCELLEEKKKYIISRQLLKSGTSIGANSMEAQHAESKADFIHKFRIAAKEGEETEYWLLLCHYAKNYPCCDELLSRIQELNKVVGKIISSARKKHPFSYLCSFFL